MPDSHSGGSQIPSFYLIAGAVGHKCFYCPLALSVGVFGLDPVTDLQYLGQAGYDFHF